MSGVAFEPGLRQTTQDATKSPKTVRDKLHGTFQSVYARLKTNLLTRLCTCSELVVGGRDLLKIS